jgi:hypothetical protein
MARERYLLGTEGDTIHDNQIVLETKSDIRKNWWYYHKSMIIVGVIIGAIIFSIVHSVVSKVKPDYQIAFMTSVTWSEEMLTDFENYLVEFADDRNNDGRVVVALNAYMLDSSRDTTIDPQILQASMVRFTTDCMVGDSMIFIHDETAFSSAVENGLDGFFLYNGGEEMAGDAKDFENTWINWSEVKAAENYEVADIDTEGGYVSAEDLKVFFQRYRFSFRGEPSGAEKKEELKSYYEDSKMLYKRLIEDEKLLTEEK